MSNIVSTWMEVETYTPGRTLADSLRDMNAETGLIVRSNRIYEWRDGIRPIPPSALRYMARVVISRVLREAGINTLRLSDDVLDRIADRLTPPLRA